MVSEPLIGWKNACAFVDNNYFFNMGVISVDYVKRDIYIRSNNAKSSHLEAKVRILMLYSEKKS